jgi:hypothetical protein
VTILKPQSKMCCIEVEMGFLISFLQFVCEGFAWESLDIWIKAYIDYCFGSIPHSEWS